jgi:predicted component of type VI protein secretion system
MYSHLLSGDNLLVKEGMDKLIQQAQQKAFDELCSTLLQESPERLRQIIESYSSRKVVTSEQARIYDIYQMSYRGALREMGLLFFDWE